MLSLKRSAGSDNSPIPLPWKPFHYPERIQDYISKILDGAFCENS